MSHSPDPGARSLDDHIARAVEEIVRPLHGVLERELRRLLGDMANAAAAERTAALEEVRGLAAAEKEAAVREAVDEARATLEAATAAAITAAVTEAVSGAKAEAELTLTAAQDEATRRLEAMKAEAAADVDAARAESVRLGHELAAAESEAEASLTDARVAERHADLAHIDRLLDTIRQIDEARSMSEVLDALASQAPVESGRVAVFLVRNGTLHGWRFSGFTDVPGDPRAIELPLDEAAVIARAVNGHTCAATSDRDVAAGERLPLQPGSLLYLPPGRAGFSAPVCVAGQVVAVVYADEGSAAEPPVPSPWPELAEITARYASRCLELLMAARLAAARWTRGATEARQEAPDPSGEDEDAARRYARLLISEVKLYHESDVNEGKRERDLFKRLKPEIDRARRLYEERVSPGIRARADCFEQELVRILADGNAGLLGPAA